MTTIVFDLGGVLSSPDGKVETIAAALEVPAATLEPIYWGSRAAYDAGASNEWYWGRVGQALGVPMDQSRADLLGRLDADTWAGIRPTAQAILTELHAAGVSTVVLSNAPIDMAEALDRATWRDLVGPVFISGVLKVVKPSPTIFDQVAAELGVKASELYFIDDSPANVTGAQACGWNAHLWVDDQDTRAWLRRLGVLG